MCTRVFLLLVFTIFSKSAFSQCVINTTDEFYEELDICINGDQYVLDISGIPVISELEVEFVVLGYDPDISEVLQKPILGISESAYEGVLEYNCLDWIEASDLVGVTVVPIAFYQADLDAVTNNPVGGGVLGAGGNESLSEFKQLFPNITAIPVPDPLTIQGVIDVLRSDIIGAIVGIDVCVVVDTSLEVPLEFVSTPSAGFEFDPCHLNLINTTMAPLLVDSVHWDFGNGLSSNEFQPDYVIYESAGEYSVSLSVCDEGECNTSTEMLSIDEELLFIDIPEEALSNAPTQFELNSLKVF